MVGDREEIGNALEERQKQEISALESLLKGKTADSQRNAMYGYLVGKGLSPCYLEDFDTLSEDGQMDYMGKTLEPVISLSHQLDFQEYLLNKLDQLGMAKEAEGIRRELEKSARDNETDNLILHAIEKLRI